MSVGRALFGAPGRAAGTISVLVWAVFLALLVGTLVTDGDGWGWGMLLYGFLALILTALIWSVVLIIVVVRRLSRPIRPPSM